MGILGKSFREKSFDELMDEYYKAGGPDDTIFRQKGYEDLFKRQFEILKAAAKKAKNTKQRIQLIACINEVKQQARARGFEIR